MNFLKQRFTSLLDASGKKSAFELLRSGIGPLLLLDGNLWETAFHQNSDAKLMGTDVHGNRYFENKKYGYTRSRWVVYANKWDYNATSVTPEWHGWLNYINDLPPTEHEYKKPIYSVEPYITRTGTSECYGPKGSWYNPAQRNWKKYEAWQPPQSS